MKLLLRNALHFLFNRYTLSLPLTLFFDQTWSQGEMLHELLSGNILSLIGLFLVYGICIGLFALLSKATSEVDPIFSSTIIERIGRLIDEADSRLTIVSPYINIGNTLLERIVKTARSGVQVTIVHNSAELQKPEFSTQFGRLSGAGVLFFHHPRLHAKIVINESAAVVSSLNLLSSSIENTIEAGFVVNHGPRLKEIENFIHEILSSDLCHATKSNEQISRGYCIKTGKEIEFNKWKPIEYSTYVGLRDSGRLTDKGTFCHYCGKAAPTSQANPFCGEHQSMN